MAMSGLLMGLGLASFGWTGEVSYLNQYGLVYDSVEYKEESYDRYSALIQPVVIKKDGFDVMVGYKLGLEQHKDSVYYNSQYITGIPRIGVVGSVGEQTKTAVFVESGKQFYSIVNDLENKGGLRVAPVTSILFVVYLK